MDYAVVLVMLRSAAICARRSVVVCSGLYKWARVARGMASSSGIPVCSMCAISLSVHESIGLKQCKNKVFRCWWRRETVTKQKPLKHVNVCVSIYN